LLDDGSGRMCVAYMLDKIVLLGLTDGVRPLSRSRSEDMVNISRSIARRDADPKTPFSVLSPIRGRWTMFRGFGQRATYRVLAFPRDEASAGQPKWPTIPALL
jgi:glycerol-3-phosphate dehydrogenase